MARMYGLVARLPEGSYGVFKDRDEACAWLGIDARRLASAHGTTRTRSTVG
jgi:hypothetical protein